MEVRWLVPEAKSWESTSRVRRPRIAASRATPAPVIPPPRIRQSTSVGIGGDPIIGTSFVEILNLFEEDPATHAVVLVGEIGGTAEQDAIDFIEAMSKPVIAYVVGVSAPPGKTMGHAGAIVSKGGGTAREKIQAFESAGIMVGNSPEDIVNKLKNIVII